MPGDAPGPSEAVIVALETACRDRAALPEEISAQTLTEAAEALRALRSARQSLQDRVTALEEEAHAYRLAYAMPDDPDWLKRLAEGGAAEHAQLTAYLGHPPEHLDLKQTVWDWGDPTPASKTET